MKKRLLSILMLCCMVLSLLPAAALAAPEEPAVAFPRERVSRTETADGQESGSPEDDLFYQFMLHQAQGEPRRGSASLFSTGTNTAGSKLTGNDKAMYDLLKPLISKVANGDLTYTVFSISPSALGADGMYSASDLNVSSIVSGGAITEEAADAIYALIDFNLNAINNALLADCPYELYWYKKTNNAADPGACIAEYPLITADYNASTGWEWKIHFVDGASINVAFAVEKDYAAGTANYPWDDAGTQFAYVNVNGTKVNTAKAAARNAQAVVTAHAGEPDFLKLKHYRDEICDRVTYDREAANNSTVPLIYGDPWQLVSVFDGDTGTNVVCEGYSKAFQYLCDLTSAAGGFESPLVQCYTVTGEMEDALDSGDTPEGHMWNVLTMPDGRNYLVDVTNCDTGKAGYPDRLFCKGAYVSGGKWMVDTNPGLQTISYDLDGVTIGMWGGSNPILTSLSGSDYGECRVTYNAAPGVINDGSGASTQTKTYYLTLDPAATSLLPRSWVTPSGVTNDLGWYTENGDGSLVSTAGDLYDLSGTTDGSFVSTSVKDGGIDVALKALWECAVTFDDNDDGETAAALSESSRYVLYNTKLTDSGALPAGTLAGYDALAGWYRNPTGSDSPITSANDVTVTEPMTLYARWNFTPVFDLDGGNWGSALPGGMYLTEKSPIVEQLSGLPVPEKAACDFAGWMDVDGNVVKSTDLAAKAKHSTLKAKWDYNGYDYQLVYDANASDAYFTTDPNPVPLVHGGAAATHTFTLALPDENTPVRPGHAFRGWGETSASTTTVPTITVNGTAGGTKTATVYAVWVPVITLSEGQTQQLQYPGPWVSSDCTVAVVYDDLLVALKAGETTITNGTYSYLVRVSAGTPSVLTDGSDSLTWFFHAGSAGNKLIVAGNAGSITDAKPALVGSYKDGQMLSVQFITVAPVQTGVTDMVIGGVDIPDGATKVKLFWLDGSYAPRSRCGEILLTGGA